MKIRTRTAQALMWLFAIAVGPFALIGFVGAFVLAGLLIGKAVFVTCTDKVFEWATDRW